VRQLFQRRRLGAIARSATADAVGSEFVGKSPYFQLARASQDRRAKDDATMPKDDVMALEDRLAKLEQTMAEGFFEQRQRSDSHGKQIVGLADRMIRLEDRMFALDSKLDIFSETIRGDLRTVLDAVTASTEEMRRTTQAIRAEHAADRELTRAILNDHAIRIRTLESTNPEPMEPR
jgi:hypothetical protein